MLLRDLAASALLVVLGPIVGLGVFGLVALSGNEAESETFEHIALSASAQMAGLTCPTELSSEHFVPTVGVMGPDAGTMPTENGSRTDRECDRLR